MNKPSLVRSTAIYWIGRLASRSVSFLLLPVYTALIMPAQWGVLNILFITADLVGIIAVFQLPAALFRFWAEAPDELSRRRLAGTAIAVPIIASSILFIPAYIWAAECARLMGIDGHAGFIRICLATQQLAIAVEVMQAEMRLRDQAGRYATLEIVQNFMIAGLSIFFVAGLHLGGAGVLIGNLVAFAIMFMILAPVFLRRVAWAWDPQLMRHLASFALPLIPSAIAMAMIHNVDRYFIQHLLGTTEVGIYSIAHRFATMISVFFLSPFLLVWDPKSYELAKHPDASRRFGRIATYVVCALLFLALGLMAAGRDLVRIFTAPAYHRAAEIIPPLALAYAVYSLDPLLRFGLLQKRRTRVVLMVVVLSCLVTVAGNMVLLPLMGLVGAAWTTLAAFSTLVFLDYVFARKNFKYTFEWKKLIITGTVFALLLGVSAFIHPQNPWLGLGIKSILFAAYPAILATTILKQETTAMIGYIRGMIAGIRKTT